jgi:hypothetical protein
MTTLELGALVKGLAAALRDYVLSTQKALSDRLSALETQDLIPGQDGKPGPPGKNGRDGQDGKDGANGKDGLGFDDLQLEYDGERSFTFRWVKGTRVVEKSFAVPVVLYRDVFDAGRTYEPADMVTCAGSTWIAKRKTTQRPDEDGPGARDWTLCAKRGPAGKPGPAGLKGQDGKDGAPGRDLTQIGSDGRKW